MPPLNKNQFRYWQQAVDAGERPQRTGGSIQLPPGTLVDIHHEPTMQGITGGVTAEGRVPSQALQNRIAKEHIAEQRTVAPEPQLPGLESPTHPLPKSSRQKRSELEEAAKQHKVWHVDNPEDRADMDRRGINWRKVNWGK